MKIIFLLPLFLIQFPTLVGIFQDTDLLENSEKLFRQMSTFDTQTGCVYGDCENGWGKWEYENGYYEGFWKNGKRDGYGRYNWNTGQVYYGFYKDNRWEGFGHYEDESGYIEGIYSRGAANGWGVELRRGENFGEVQRKVGYFESHELTQEFKVYYIQSNVGCQEGDCENGYGKYQWKGGDLFEGFFEQGSLFMGTYNFSNGDKYQGFFNDQNEFHGQGLFRAYSGGFYYGEFRDGLPHGRGVMVDEDKKTFIGEFVDGKIETIYIKN